MTITSHSPKQRKYDATFRAAMSKKVKHFHSRNEPVRGELQNTPRLRR